MDIPFHTISPADWHHTRNYPSKVSSSKNIDTSEKNKTKIQAIILAAGCGSRLGDSNGYQPKCLAKVNGQRLIDQQLAALSQIGIEDVCVVTGYKAETVSAALDGRAHLIHNPIWSTSNSLYSLSLCRHWVKHSLVVLNCDVLTHPEVLTRLIEQKHSAFAYDSASGDDCEHMKVELVNGLLTAMSKQLPQQRTCGENVGILYFSSEAAQLLFTQAEHLIRSGQNQLWLASAVEQVAKHVPLRGIDIRDLPWIEIDFEQDLNYAQRWVGPAIHTSIDPIEVTLA